MMSCEQAGGLLHALIDGELDSGQNREVEAHVAGCPRCTAALRDYRDMRRMMSRADLGFTAPASLRQRIEAAIPAPSVRTRAPTRRWLLQGFALGAAVSAAAAGVAFVVMRGDEDQRVLGDAVSAHLRSLQGDRLTDVPSGDRNTVKPWFSGKVNVAPPVVDLTAQGFALLGGRLDYLGGKAVAAIVYRRGAHVINLFVATTAETGHTPARAETVQGFNTQRWADQGFRFVAISDIGADELQQFHKTFEAALHAGA
jgi:anti-sigma factor RsiW